MGAAESALTGLTTIFRSLRYRNYRLFFGGQMVSLVGTWMQMLATGWLVYSMTDSQFLLGLTNFCGQVPTFLLVPLTGVLADRFDRRRTMIVTQTLMMVQAFVLAALTIKGIVTIPEIMILSVVLGIIGAFDIPSRQAFVVEMIEDKKDLGNAIALNSSMVNGARLLGPVLAAKLVELYGEGHCFLANAISYIAVIAALLAMTPTPPRPKAAPRHPAHEFKEGIIYAWGSTPIRSVLLLLAMMSLLSTPMMVLSPVFARDVLHGSVKTLGYLMTFSGLGALVGAAYLASRRNIIGLATVIAVSAGLFGTGLVLFALSRTVWISLVLMLFTGFGFMVQIAASNTMLQTIVDDDKRGRIMALWAMAFMGMGPFGSLLAGGLGHWLGAPTTVLISGICILGGVILFVRGLPAFHREVQAHYSRQLAEPTSTAPETKGR